MTAVERKISSLREENEEALSINAGQVEEFLDYLDCNSQELFDQMRDLAESKKRWIKMYDKMMSYINSRDFDDAMNVFEELSEELF